MKLDRDTTFETYDEVVAISSKVFREKAVHQIRIFRMCIAKKRQSSVLITWDLGVHASKHKKLD